jgi:ATP-dependent Clp protease ATP-binding subunit ClpA
MIFMTSNLGATEMSALSSPRLGFQGLYQNGTHEGNIIDEKLNQKLSRTGVEAARRKFTPEFMNRIDKVVVFRSLKEHHLRRILDIELNSVQERITESAGTKFIFECSDSAKEFLLGEGIDLKYGARHLKRAIERFLVYPLSNLVATQQVETGDFVMVDFDTDKGQLNFTKHSGKMIISDSTDDQSDEEPLTKSDAVGMPLPTASAAPQMSKSKGEDPREA